MSQIESRLKSLEEYLLVYDVNCGPCSKFKRMIDFLDKHDRLNYTSLVDADEQGVLNSLPRNRRRRSFHLISPSGEISSGADAIPILVGLLPLGGFPSSVIIVFPPAQSLVNFVYSTLSRLHDAGSCEYGKLSSRPSKFTIRDDLSTQENVREQMKSRMLFLRD